MNEDGLIECRASVRDKRIRPLLLQISRVGDILYRCGCLTNLTKNPNPPPNGSSNCGVTDDSLQSNGSNVLKFSDFFWLRSASSVRRPSLTTASRNRLVGLATRG